MARTERIHVRTEGNVLWVGGEAYPLRNIARAMTVKIVVDRGARITGFLKGVTLWLVLGVAAVTAISFSEVRDTEPRALPLVVGVVAALVTLSVLRLAFALARKPLYALVIDTSGGHSAAVVSQHRDQVQNLVREITKAIADGRPINMFVQHTRYEFGDTYNVSGNSGNVGRGNKIVQGA